MIRKAKYSDHLNLIKIGHREDELSFLIPDWKSRIILALQKQNILTLIGENKEGESVVSITAQQEYGAPWAWRTGNLLVTKDIQGRGWGVRIFKNLEDRIVQLKGKVVYAYIESDNRISIVLHKKAGYTMLPIIRTNLKKNNSPSGMKSIPLESKTYESSQREKCLKFFEKSEVGNFFNLLSDFTNNTLFFLEPPPLLYRIFQMIRGKKSGFYASCIYEGENLIGLIKIEHDSALLCLDIDLIQNDLCSYLESAQEYIFNKFQLVTNVYIFHNSEVEISPSIISKQFNIFADTVIRRYEYYDQKKKTSLARNKKSG